MCIIMIKTTIKLLLFFIIASSALATWTEHDGLLCNGDSSRRTNKYVDFLKHFENGLKIIRGSDLIRNAFRLNQNSYLSMTTSDIFPEGLPIQFSFSCTFRNLQTKISKQISPFSLLNIDDFMGNSQFSLNVIPNDNLIELDFPDSRTLRFKHVKFYQNDWNKIDISFQPSNISLFVNCHKHDTQSIDLFPELDLDGDITLCNAASIDIQSMSLDCDATRPLREKCDEIIRTPPKMEYKTVEIVKECCEPTKLDRGEIKLLIFDVLNDNLDYFSAYFRGNPGKPGIGLPGEIGPKGSNGLPGENGRCIQGEKGERGEKGNKGDTGFAGQKGNAGSQGPIGITGATIIGPKGDKGMRGIQGHAIHGPQGPPGRDGICNKCDRLGLEGLQFMLSQNQRQIKGPPKIIFKKFN
ncbi:uncharacterized protein LOC124498751 isoform X2 [Dermatophagoides farinae]|uniref:uncharacterized protein LOC124498751 isoform X2 n=1 Tax=Dermatophagoides farinae TaxID=6954 RepID=UPI003F5D57FA